MKIYTITHNTGGYNALQGHVIVANNKNEVRNLAISNFASEGTDVWRLANIEVHGEYTGAATEPFILLSDFNAG